MYTVHNLWIQYNLICGQIEEYESGTSGPVVWQIILLSRLILKTHTPTPTHKMSCPTSYYFDLLLLVVTLKCFFLLYLNLCTHHIACQFDMLHCVLLFSCFLLMFPLSSSFLGGFFFCSWSCLRFASQIFDFSLRSDLKLGFNLFFYFTVHKPLVRNNVSLIRICLQCLLGGLIPRVLFNVTRPSITHW